MLHLTWNEFLRNIQRVSTYVVILLTVVCVFGFGWIANFAIHNQAQNRQNNTVVTPDNQTAMSEQLSALQTQIANAADPAIAAQLQAQYDIQSQAQAAGIFVVWATPLVDTDYSDPATFQEVAVFDAVKTKISSLTTQSADQSAVLAALSDKYLTAALSNNLADFLSADNDAFVQVSGILDASGLPDASDPSNQAYIYANSLRLQYNVTYLNTPGTGTQNDLISAIYLNKIGLLQGVNPSTSAVLSNADITNANNTILINLYKLEHNLAAAQDTDRITAATNAVIPPYLISFGITIVSILMAILAGATIAQEIATGAIKGLIIAPVKRWKIFLSKFLSITILAILLDLLVYAVSALTLLIFYSGGGLSSYFAVIGGGVTAIPFFLYLFFLTLLYIPELIILILMAMMLSTLTRNNAVSISIVVAFSLVGNAVVTVLAMLFGGDWLLFMPFQHFQGLAEKVFPIQTNVFSGGGGMGALTNAIPTTSLRFSIIYLVVGFFLMYLTAHESFTKRDI